MAVILSRPAIVDIVAFPTVRVGLVVSIATTDAVDIVLTDVVKNEVRAIVAIDGVVTRASADSSAGEGAALVRALIVSLPLHDVLAGIPADIVSLLPAVDRVVAVPAFYEVLPTGHMARRRVVVGVDDVLGRVRIRQASTGASRCPGAVASAIANPTKRPTTTTVQQKT